MPDIDPSTLNRPDPIQTSLNPSSLSLSKPNAISAPPPASKAVKVVNTGLQRIDLEPIYTSLKAAVGENWTGYKEAIGRFVLGRPWSPILQSSCGFLYHTIFRSPIKTKIPISRRAQSIRTVAPHRPLYPLLLRHRTPA